MKHIRLHRMSGSTRRKIDYYAARHAARLVGRIAFLGQYERSVKRGRR